MGWTVRRSNSGKASFSAPFPADSVPSSSLTMCTESFPWVKRPDRGSEHPSPDAELRMGQCCLYLRLPSVPAWASYGATFTFTL